MRLTPLQFVSLALTVALAPAHSAPAPVPKTAYQQLRARYQNLVSNWARPTKLLLILPSNDRPEREGLFYSGLSFDEQGGAFPFIRDSLSASGGFLGGEVPMAPPKLRRFDQLLANLPDDHGVLPPEGRQLIVRIGTGPSARVRIYDRANLPDNLVAAIRLWGPDWVSVVDSVPADRQWKGEASGHFLGTSPDGRLLVSSNRDRDFKIWDVKTHELKQTVRFPTLNSYSPTAMAFSPDGTLVAFTAFSSGESDGLVLSTRDWKPLLRYSEPVERQSRAWLSSPSFTADGRYLMFTSSGGYQPGDLWSVPQLRCFEMPSGKSVASLPDMPAGATTYDPAPRLHRAVYSTVPGEIRLWDSKRRRDVAVLAAAAQIGAVAFSPDNAAVAVVTLERGGPNIDSPRKPHLRLWKTSNGQLLREFEGSINERCNLVWSPDGRYLLGGARYCDNVMWEYENAYRIGVWNTRTGRQSGGLDTGGQPVSNLTLLPDGQLIAGSDRIWDLPSALAKVSAFQKPLSRR